MIRTVELKDAQALLNIYAPYVTKTAISFEYDVPSLDEFTQRIIHISKNYPYVVAEENGEILGYAYAHVFYGREAYCKSVEVSIYVDCTKKQKGIGKALYTELEHLLKAQGIEALFACIAYSEDDKDPYLTRDSIHFHQKIGYVQCGHFHRCGYKFNRCYDVVYMEKHI